MTRTLIVTRTLIAVTLFCVSAAAAQQPSDEAVLAALLRTAADEAAGQCGARRVLLTLRPDDAPALVWQVFSEALLRHGAGVHTSGTDLQARLSVDVREMKSYAVSLDKSSYLKTISLSVGVMLEDRERGAITWSKEFSLSDADTLRGEPPFTETDFLEEGSPGWTESWLTPLTVTATAIVLVVLLFTVRGS